ncbi:hypothetical protein CEP53_002796 [Fusarium sp. AF-6]|nr:hypothetical protein CEP53_002796 [Fusarium sp. AF-6]
MTTIHILRHGQGRHNVQRGYPYRDPPLTEVGCEQAKAVRRALSVKPDLILVSPMTRTIQTMNIVFGHLFNDSSGNKKVEVQVWPELREAHDAICNKGISRAELAAKFPHLDFSACRRQWDYSAHSPERAAARAERIRRHLGALASSGKYKNIFLVTHRGLVAFLVQGPRFSVCEHRSYQFAAGEEVDKKRLGVNIDTGLEQDFGPTLLVPKVSGDMARVGA